MKHLPIPKYKHHPSTKIYKKETSPIYVPIENPKIYNYRLKVGNTPDN